MVINMNRVEMAQMIVNDYLYKVKSVKVDEKTSIVTIKFESGTSIRITGKFADAIIKTKDEDLQ